MPLADLRRSLVKNRNGISPGRAPRRVAPGAGDDVSGRLRNRQA